MVACRVSDQFTSSYGCVVTKQSKCYTPPIDYRNNCISANQTQGYRYRPCKSPAEIFFNLRWDRLINNLQGVMTLYYLTNISGGRTRLSGVGYSPPRCVINFLHYNLLWKIFWLSCSIHWRHSKWPATESPLDDNTVQIAHHFTLSVHSCMLVTAHCYKNDF